MGKTLTEWGLVRRPPWTWALAFGFPIAVVETLVRTEEEGVLGAAISGAIFASVLVMLWTLMLDKQEPEAFRRLMPHQRRAAVRALESGQLPADPDVAQAAIDLATKHSHRPPRLALARVVFVALTVGAAALVVRAVVNHDWPEVTASVIILVGAIWLLTVCPGEQQLVFEQARTLLSTLPPDGSPSARRNRR